MLEPVASYTLRYHSSRKEVMRFYWKQWRAKYWSLHLFAALVITSVVSFVAGNRLALRDMPWCFAAIAVLVTAAMMLWPQVRFKPQERVLDVGPDGWSTRIGKLSGSRPWVQVAAIVPGQDTVSIVGINGNALVIPDRAFAEPGQKDAFVKDVRQWHASRKRPN
jgi:hypothetical protein